MKLTNQIHQVRSLSAYMCLHNAHRENWKLKLSLQFTINLLRQDRGVSFERSSDVVLFDCPK